MLLILTYHSIRDRDYLFSVSPETFRAQLRYFADRGPFIRLAEVPAWCASGTHELTFALAFDDGLADNFTHALPILSELELPATVFVPTGRVAGALDTKGGTFPVMSWEELRTMRESGLVDVESHTHSHAILPTCTDEGLDSELTRPLHEIERNLGYRPRLVAYPHGKHDERVRACAREHYEAGFATSGAVTDAAVDPFSIPRVMMTRTMRMHTCALMTHGLYWRAKALKERMIAHNKPSTNY